MAGSGRANMKEPQPSGTGLKVLLIEDDDTHAELAVTFLAEADPGRFEVDLARNGAAGLRLAAERGYDAIVLDYHLGDLDGLTVLARLRDAGVVAPALVLTGAGSERVAAGALR